MHYVYILISETRKNWSYVGSTNDLERRFKEHSGKRVRSTKSFIPLRMVHVEEFQDASSAHKREKYLKTGFGREEKLEILKHSGIV